MVKNHQHGAIGAVKHGSADHLRDGAKRSRLDDAVVPTVAATPSLPDVLSADALGNLTIEDKSDADALVAALSSTNAVTTLDMRRVGFGPECALKLAAALRANSSITRLNIERNGVGLSGGVALGEALGHNASLQSLDMSLNDVAPEGGAAIARGLRSNASAPSLGSHPFLGRGF